MGTVGVMKQRRRADRQQETIERLEQELGALGPYEEIARAIRERTITEAFESGDLEGAFRDAMATVERDQRADMLLNAFDALPLTTRAAILYASFGDDELRALLEDRRRDELERARRATVGARARAAGFLDTHLLDSDQLVTIGLFQPKRVESGRTMGRRSDYCTRELLLRATDAPRLRVIADRLLLRGAYDGTNEYPRVEWEQERLADHHVVHVGVTAVDGEVHEFDDAIYPGSTLDVRDGSTLVRTRLLVGYVEIDGQDVFSQ